MIHKATIKTSAAELDNTAFGASTAYHSRLGGLKDWQVDLEFNQDFAAAQTDALLFPLLGTTVALEIRSQAGGRSVTNPGYNGNVLVSDYSPVQGAVGDLAVNSASWKGAGTLLRSTS